MQGRLRQLRLYFGLDPQSMARLMNVTVEEWERWESSAPLSDGERDSLAARVGVSPGWLAGADVPMFGPRLLELQAWLAEDLKALGGMRLISMMTATTGERIAYVVNLLRKQAPDLFSLECVAGWLGLSPGSTDLLLRGELDAGTPVIVRASDLTGVSGDWFRQGPVYHLQEESDRDDP